MERSSLAVSPFDGANRIRFKGSPDFGLRNSDSRFEEKALSIRIPQSAFRNRWTLSHVLRARLPRNVFDFQTVEWILDLFIFGCKFLPALLFLLKSNSRKARQGAKMNRHALNSDQASPISTEQGESVFTDPKALSPAERLDTSKRTLRSGALDPSDDAVR